MSFTDDKELQEYRNIMEPPKTSGFADGFDWKTVAGAILLGLIVNPAAEYLGLVIGTGAAIGNAMKWVLVILFAEIAKRSFTSLRTQELWTLHFMTGVALGDPFSGYLWKQYVAQSEYVQGLGLAAELPRWAFPQASDIEAAGRTFLTKAWLPIIGLSVLSILVSKLDGFGLGYVMYRVTSDVEKLPFPFAPVSASGIVALSSDRGNKESWRWRCFAIGGMIGIIWGAIYVCVPMITEAFLPKRVEIIPLIFIDYTAQVGNYLPAVPFNLVIDVAAFLSGMMIPFWGVVGSVMGLLITMVANPILQKTGVLTTWQPGMSFIDTTFNNHMDFYLSFGIGLTFAVTFSQFFVFLSTSVKNWLKPKAKEVTHRQSAGAGLREAWRILVRGNKERGDFSIFVAIAIYLCGTFSWIALGVLLIGSGYPWMIMTFYALVYTPLISYATAKLEGICGQAINIPYLHELTILLSGYKGVDIWFAPMPIRNMGAETVGFRVLELTGTKIISQVKTLLLTVPIVILASFFTCELLWRMSPVPSSAYPYTERMWELNVRNWCVMYTSTMEGGSQFLEALHGDYALWGLVSGGSLFAILSALGLPIMLVYGAVWGLAQNSPGAIFCTIAGALFGKFYFKKKYKDMWLKYMASVLAGFGCGMGLTSMIAMSINVIAKMISPTLW